MRTTISVICNLLKKFWISSGSDNHCDHCLCWFYGDSCPYCGKRVKDVPK